MKDSRGASAQQWGWSKKTSLLLRLATFCLLGLVVVTADAIVQQNASLPLIVMLMILFLAFMTLGLISRRRDRLAWQNRRDADAERIMREVVQDSTRAFALYLRSFDWTGVLPIPNPVYRPNDDPLKELATLDLEEFLTRGITETLPVIALGLKGEAIGAGRYTTDDSTWKVDVEALGKRATFILIVPLFSYGTLWEMGFLRQEELLGKTIVVMPPTVGPFTLTLRERWRQAQAKLAQEGVGLPDYDPEGGLFTLNVSGERILKTAAIPPSPAGVMEALSSLLQAG